MLVVVTSDGDTSDDIGDDGGNNDSSCKDINNNYGDRKMICDDIKKYTCKIRNIYIYIYIYIKKIESN